MIIQPAERIQGVQEYYFSIKQQEIAVLEKQGNKVINLGIGSPDLAPSEEVIQSLVQSATNPKSHGYQPYKGLKALRDAVGEWMQTTYGVKLDSDTEILPLMGSKEGIFHISMAFLNPGDKVLVPELGYPAYRAVTHLVGAQWVNYPLTEDYYPDFSKLTSDDLQGVKMMWLNYPHMPTGTAASREVYLQAIEFGRKNKILVINDNPYSLILNDHPQSIFGIEGSKDVALELNSLSKSHNMAGWRVGWLAGKKDYIDAVLRVKSNFDSGMFKGIQEAAIKALKTSADWHKELNTIYAGRRKKAGELFNKLNVAYSETSQGLFLWGKLPENAPDAEPFCDALLNEKFLFLTPGSLFGDKGKRFIRVSLCAELDVYDEAIKRLI
ncbi:MAG: aminotransferase class I/II-fold pyridoxal phosphate-dependent enzyme [Cyclobacteriaceae bacterium]|nr:aminotransferase class I/II-fold pyridoxal phosphate-dependent enzyme [Cyclobacteriaceae bacterium]